MEDLFQRANKIGLGCIQSWLPNGRLVENTWFCRTHDNEYDVIVDINNGNWEAHYGTFGGENTVSLYDWINHIEDLKKSVIDILEKYDPDYFPSENNTIIIPKRTVIDRKPVKKKEPKKEFLDDDKSLPFKILGKGLDRRVYFHCYNSKEVIAISAPNLAKGAYLMELAPMSLWGKYFQNTNGGIAWQSAQNYILRQAEVMDTFDPSRIRRSGAWRDNGDIVFHAGEQLFVNGNEIDLLDRGGKYIYEKSRKLPIDLKKVLSTEEAARFAEICSMLCVKTETQRHFLAGWCLLAPFSGALNWRSHIWITGPAGSGKSWVLDNIIDKFVGLEFGIKGTGTSTPAGIRQNLQSTTLGVVLDEMESDNKTLSAYIEQILKIFREASSGIESAASTLHGSVDQNGKTWLVRSMACFASIGASLRQDADIDRFSLITMTTSEKPLEERIDIFKKLENAIQMLTIEYCRAFVARTYMLINEVLRCIDVMIEQATDLLGSRRHGDQIGTLLAGSWMVTHDKSATAREARDWLNTMNLDQINSVAENRSTELKAIEEILAYQVRVTDGHISTTQTIGACLEYYFHEPQALERDEDSKCFPGASKANVKRVLEQYGIKPTRYNNGNWIQIAVNFPALQRILERTPYENVYAEFIGRLECCDGKTRGPGLFSGIRKRYLQVNANILFDEVPF